MHQSRNPQCAIHNRNVPLVHTSNNTNGALWDTGPVHRGIRREVHCAKLPAVRAKIMLLSLVEFLREAHTFCWSQIIHRNFCTSRLSKLPEHIHNVYRHFVLICQNVFMGSRCSQVVKGAFLYAALSGPPDNIWPECPIIENLRCNASCHINTPTSMNSMDLHTIKYSTHTYGGAFLYAARRHKQFGSNSSKLINRTAHNYRFWRHISLCCTPTHAHTSLNLIY